MFYVYTWSKYTFNQSNDHIKYLTKLLKVDLSVVVLVVEENCLVHDLKQVKINWLNKTKFAEYDQAG